jgi:hypothetical protein
MWFSRRQWIVRGLLGCAGGLEHIAQGEKTQAATRLREELPPALRLEAAAAGLMKGISHG